MILEWIAARRVQVERDNVPTVQKAGALMMLDEVEELVKAGVATESTTEGRWVTTAKALEIFDIHPNTLRRWVQSGRIKQRKMGDAANSTTFFFIESSFYLPESEH